MPTFAKVPFPMQTILVAHLDIDRPLSEPKWVKSGDVQEWLKSMFGRMFWVAGEAADGWEKKIEVVDPDPVRVASYIILIYVLLMLLILMRSPRLSGLSLKDGRTIHRQVH